MAVYFYIRMSHRDSTKSGASEVSQMTAGRNYRSSILPGHTIGNPRYPQDAPPGCFIDRSQSGWRNGLHQRPAGIALLNIVQPGDHIIFYDVNRAYRSVTEFCRETEILLDCDITPHFVMDRFDFRTACGKLIGRMLATIAEYYSDMISERIREGLAIKRKYGTQPWGRRDKIEWKPSDIVIPELDVDDQLPANSGRLLRYIRCSHADSTHSGLGLEVQREGINRYAETMMANDPGLQLHQDLFVDETISAYHLPLQKREAGARLLSDVRPGDHILFYRCDRGFRMPHDAALTAKELKEEGIAIHLVDNGINSMSDFGDLYLTMLSVFAAIESRIKSNRNKEVARYLRTQGRPLNQNIPTYCVAKKRDGRGKLRHDYEKMVAHAMCWQLRKLYTQEVTAEILNALEANKRNMTAKRLRNNGHWLTERKIHKREQMFKRLVEELDHELITSLLDEACNRLEQGVAGRYQSISSVALPLSDIRDRLADHETAPALQAN